MKVKICTECRKLQKGVCTRYGKQPYSFSHAEKCKFYEVVGGFLCDHSHGDELCRFVLERVPGEGLIYFQVKKKECFPHCDHIERYEAEKRLKPITDKLLSEIEGMKAQKERIKALKNSKKKRGKK